MPVTGKALHRSLRLHSDRAACADRRRGLVGCRKQKPSTVSLARARRRSSDRRRGRRVGSDTRVSDAGRGRAVHGRDDSCRGAC